MPLGPPTPPNRRPHLEAQARAHPQFGGRPYCTYDLTLHVRGVGEPKNFTGGTVQLDHFQTGGTPIKNDYNFYSLHVSAPEATHTFNRNEKKVGHTSSPSTIKRPSRSKAEPL